MGDSFIPSRYADDQSSVRPGPPPSLHHSHSNGNGPTNGEEEPYTIKCICGYADDTYDGNTVFCDGCNTWQHIACYYFPESTLEDDFEHNCVECNPSQRGRLDFSAANVRQRSLRQPLGPNDDRKNKRPGPKNHRKTKTRDTNGNTIQTNGWSGPEGQPVDPRGESPRDQGPPYKRPKTSHKYSGSVNNTSSRTTSGRNRSRSLASAVAQDQIKLPLKECPDDFLSPDFIRVHHENTHFHPAQANLHLNIEVTNLLSTWLDDQESFYEVTGKSHNEVFKRFPQPIEELERSIQKHTRIDSEVNFHGEHPAWPFLTVDSDLVAGDYVGELRGSIGRLDEYKQDESNQWPKLRHPDHFVFFHPSLPICIDSRSEGTILRYARRSCRPNLQMETIITGSREYRFCFTASDDIPRDTEITIPWDTKGDSQLYSSLAKVRGAVSESDFQYVSHWVGAVLAHFGGCACEQQTRTVPCLLAHFDRRLSHLWSELPAAQTGKPRRKRQTNKLSPSDAIKASNSRASSGGPPQFTDNDVDIEMEDERSPSRSTDNESSRDATPFQAQRGDVLVEGGALSERDKRKLMQSEKLFEQLKKEQGSKSNQSNGPKRKKRSSGSNVNTPTTGTQRHGGNTSVYGSNPESPNTGSHGLFDYQSDTKRTPATGPGHPASSASHGQRASGPTTQRPKPAYRDALIQTVAPIVDPTSLPEPQRKSLLPRSRQLLRRSLLHTSQARLGEDIAQETARSSADVDKAPLGTIEDKETTTREKHRPHDLANTENETLHQQNLGYPDPVETKELVEAIPTITEASQSPLKPAHPPIKPPPPPWTTEESIQDASHLQRPPKDLNAAPMRIDLPPPTFPSMPSFTESPTATPSIPTASMVASPTIDTSLASGSSPLLGRNASSSSAPKPSPVKKKMSLSDYMNKRKAETPALERTQSQGQPGAGSLTDSLRKEGSDAAATTVKEP